MDASSVTFRECVFSRQFLVFYVMCLCSIFEGYYVLNVYKSFGETIPVLEDDLFLTQVGIIAAGLNSVRFVWSSAFDVPGVSFKMVYGVLLVIQIVLGLTLMWASQSKLTYTIWVSVILFAEGGHFALLPTVIKALYGNLATQVYSLLFTFTGLSNLMIILVVRSHFGHDYSSVFQVMSGLSAVSLAILLLFFKE